MKQEEICTNADLYTTRGGASSGIRTDELPGVRIRQRAGAVSEYVGGHHRLDDLIDAEGVRKAIRSVGIEVSGSLEPAQRTRIVNVFGKGQVPLDGLLRGRRTTLLAGLRLKHAAHAGGT